jgi:uncharacterized protein with PhoU and TrkA domain
MEELEEKLLETKDTSELMIDLAYSSLLYNNHDIAEEVLQMQKTVSDLAYEVQESALKMVIQDKDVPKALAIIRLTYSLENIAEAALQIADVVLRDVEPHPVIQLSLRDSDVIITSAQVSENSDLAGHTLGQVKLASHSGMWVIAIRRGRKYIYGPDQHTELAAGDTLFARGPEDGEEYFKNLASGRERVEQ